MAMSTARRELCRARHIESMPVTASALAAGDLSPDHVDWLGAANDGARRVVFAEHEPMLVAQCRQLRTFTGALRRAVQVRDRHCQHPAGCDVPVDDCDVDHTVPYANGGPTSQFNGRLQCPTQNRDSDKHDHDATPLPARPVTRLDELRARLRWQNHHYFQAESDDDHHDRDTG
jgi:hypothetical protein